MKTNEINKMETEQGTSAVTVQEPQKDTEVSGLLTVIERVALDPKIEISKLKAMLDMQERIIAKQAYHDYCAAFVSMQAEIPVVVANKKGQSNNYAPLENIVEAVQPILKEHGFAVSFKMKQDASDITVTAILMHRAGHSESTDIILPKDNSGNKNQVQAIGSSTSYGRRYALCSLLNITTRDEDDDAATTDTTIPTEQAAIIDTLIREIEASGVECRKGFLTYMKVGDVRDIKVNAYKKAIHSLNIKKSEKGGGA